MKFIKGYYFVKSSAEADSYIELYEKDEGVNLKNKLNTFLDTLESIMCPEKIVNKNLFWLF